MGVERTMGVTSTHNMCVCVSFAGGEWTDPIGESKMTTLRARIGNALIKPSVMEGKRGKKLPCIRKVGRYVIES